MTQPWPWARFASPGAPSARQPKRRAQPGPAGDPPQASDGRSPARPVAL